MKHLLLALTVAFMACKSEKQKQIDFVNSKIRVFQKMLPGMQFQKNIEKVLDSIYYYKHLKDSIEGRLNTGRPISSLCPDCDSVKDSDGKTVWVNPKYQKDTFRKAPPDTMLVLGRRALHNKHTYYFKPK